MDKHTPIRLARPKVFLKVAQKGFGNRLLRQALEIIDESGQKAPERSSTVLQPLPDGLQLGLRICSPSSLTETVDTADTGS